MTAAISYRNLPKPAIMGLSCMLLPFWPRKPQRLLAAMASEPLSSAPGGARELLLRPLEAGLCGPSCMGLGLPPRMAETEECGDRAFFWIADVMDMHSEMTKEMGSTATETGRLRYRILGVSWLGRSWYGVEESGGSEAPIVPASWASRLMVCRWAKEER